MEELPSYRAAGRGGLRSFASPSPAGQGYFPQQQQQQEYYPPPRGTVSMAANNQYGVQQLPRSQPQRRNNRPRRGQRRKKPTVEKLADMHDVSMCQEIDKPVVRAAIFALCSMEESTPLLSIKVNVMDGYYAVVAKGFIEDIDLDNFYDTFRLNPPEKIKGMIEKVYVNGEGKSVVVRVSMMSTGGEVINRVDAEPTLKKGKRNREDRR